MVDRYPSKKSDFHYPSKKSDFHYPSFSGNKIDIIQGFENSDPVWTEYIRNNNADVGINQKYSNISYSGSKSCYMYDKTGQNGGSDLYVETDENDYSDFETTYYFKYNVINNNTKFKNVRDLFWIPDSGGSDFKTDIDNGLELNINSQDTSGDFIFVLNRTTSLNGKDNIGDSGFFKLNQNQWYKCYIRLESNGYIKVEIDDGDVITWDISWTPQVNTTGNIRYGWYSARLPETELYQDDIKIKRI
jgi:hypothetical protein